jgi:predicted PurR-regulated permease PerM
LRQPFEARRSERLLREIANTHFERVLANMSQLALVLIGCVVALIALNLGKEILAPVFLAVTVGLMFGPVADMLERRGVPDAISALVVMLIFLLLIGASVALFVAPLSDWVRRWPVIWSALREQISNWKEPLGAFSTLQTQIQTALGADQSALEVTVQDGGPLQNFAFSVPGFVAQVLVFLASLYLFIATRDQIRIFTLSLCFTRKMRWRTAHVFRDVEVRISRFLLTVSAINIGVGIVDGLLLWAIGMPTPLLWGALAAMLNFIPFVGQAAMVVILFLAGLGTQNGLGGALLPPAIYLAVSTIEGNFVTPHLMGRATTINPFAIFIAITYWLWARGPIGGFIAVPSLLIVYSIVSYILPLRMVPRNKPAPLPEAPAAAVPAEAEIVRPAASS